MDQNSEILMMQIPQETGWLTSLDHANDEIECADDWISCFLNDTSVTEGQSLPRLINLDPSLHQFLCLENDSIHSVSFHNSVGLVESASFSSLLDSCTPVEGSSDVETPPLAQNPVSTLSQILQKSPPASAASSNSGLMTQSSFVSNCSDQDLWKGEDIDAKLFLDDAFAKEFLELEEEIATSKPEVIEETHQTLNQNSVNQFSGDNLEGSAIGSVLIEAQGKPNSDLIKGKESAAGQVSRAENTAKRKHSRKRKSPSPSSEDPQSDLNDAEMRNESGELEEDDEKRQARLMRNRESAQLSRQRKKVYVDELEEKLRNMASTIAELNNTVGLISAENVNLRSQLAFFYQPHGPSAKPGLLPVTHPGFIGGRPIFPGVHAPPVPIPRLKSQAPLKSSKKSKASAASNGRSKGSVGGKTKRLLGAATMGLCLVMMILAPLRSNNLAKESNGDKLDTNPTRNWEMRIGGRVLMSTNQVESPPSTLEPNISWSTLIGSMMRQKRQLNLEDESLSQGKGARATVQGSENTNKPAMDCYNLTGENRNGLAACFNGDISLHNMTEPLAASLFVRRNDKLVKIDGSLIIQAIMAGDKAAQQSKKEESKKRHSAESGIVHNVAGPAVPVGLVALESAENKGSMQNDGPVLKNQKALPSKQKVQYSSEASGSMQQWLLSDFAGTILSTGTCTEVFQFETSPAPERSEADETRASNQNMSRKMSQRSNLPRSHKNLGNSFPLPPARQSSVGQIAHDRYRVKEKLADPTKRLYREHGRQNERKCPSSMVVSVLSESHVSEDDGRQAPGGSKGISNFFVVVLLDSVKYVTYSCMLPSQGPKAQLVTS